MIYRALEIKNWSDSRVYGGQWVPARPYFGISFYGLYLRVKASLGVLTGKYDALDWEH